MNLVGMLPVRNSAWVLGLSARVALQWCDSLVILDHASTDETPNIITELQADYRNRVYRLRSQDQDWPEMAHRQQMLDAGRALGATHLAIVDDDEILTANALESIRETIAQTPHVLAVPGYNLRNGIGQYHSTGLWSNRWFSVAFADQAGLGWKSRNGYDHHHREPFHVEHPTGMRPATYRARNMPHGVAGVMHLWGASERRLRAKHAHYQVMETLKYPDKPRDMIRKMYTMAIFPGLNEPAWEFAPVQNGWWEPYAKWMKWLDLESPPWQERAVRAAVEQHGAERFAGLDLLGVV